MDPRTPPQHEVAHNALNKIGYPSAENIHSQNRTAEDIAQNAGNRNDEQPAVAAVKEEGDPGFAAGAHSEIDAMDIGYGRQEDTAN